MPAEKFSSTNNQLTPNLIHKKSFNHLANILDIFSYIPQLTP